MADTLTLGPPAVGGLLMPPVGLSVAGQPEVGPGHAGSCACASPFLFLVSGKKAKRLLEIYCHTGSPNFDWGCVSPSRTLVPVATGPAHCLTEPPHLRALLIANTPALPSIFGSSLCRRGLCDQTCTSHRTSTCCVVSSPRGQELGTSLFGPRGSVGHVLSLGREPLCELGLPCIKTVGDKTGGDLGVDQATRGPAL